MADYTSLHPAHCWNIQSKGVVSSAPVLLEALLKECILLATALLILKRKRGSEQGAVKDGVTAAASFLGCWGVRASPPEDFRLRPSPVHAGLGCKAGSKQFAEVHVEIGWFAMLCLPASFVGTSNASKAG